MIRVGRQTCLSKPEADLERCSVSPTKTSASSSIIMKATKPSAGSAPHKRRVQVIPPLGPTTKPPKTSGLSSKSSAISASVTPFLTSNSQLVTITPFQAPPPQIIFDGNNIAGNNASPATVYVGQKIELTAQIVNLPPGTIILPRLDGNWTTPAGLLPEGTAIAGFTNGAGGAPSIRGIHIVRLRPSM